MYFQTFDNLLSPSECKTIYEYINYNYSYTNSDENYSISGILNSKAILESINTRLQSHINIIIQSDGILKYNIFMDSRLNLHRNSREPNKFLILLIYLNDDNVETVFHLENKVEVLKPSIGKCVLFDSYILFEFSDNMYKKMILQCCYSYISFDNLKIY